MLTQLHKLVRHQTIDWTHFNTIIDIHIYVISSKNINGFFVICMLYQMIFKTLNQMRVSMMVAYGLELWRHQYIRYIMFAEIVVSR